ncbi:MAG: hypothetical protein K5695_13090 [Oscillospiraceae bacterium]|nr:hypothetical protein [Oscillospiraceae bacterium]
MHDISEAAQAFGYMYETLFQYFFGRNSAEANKSNRIPKYFNSHPKKCPAKALVINVLAEVLSEHPEQLPENKKTVRSYLSRSKLIDFEKIDDIYAAVNDQQFDLHRIEQYKADILDIINPQYLVALHLYMKYHKIFDRELFDAFCGMVITSDRCSRSEEIPSYSFAVLTVGEELVETIENCIYGTNGKITKTPQMLYNEVYEDFLSVAKDYPAFKAYQPSLLQLEVQICEVLDLNQTKWNPKTIKRKKDGDLYKSTVEDYFDIFINKIKSKVIKHLDTTSKQAAGQPNTRTMRSKLRVITEELKLSVYNPNVKKEQLEIKSCPVFLIDELWDRLKKYGLKGYDKDKLEPDVYGIIDEKRVVLMGRLYIIVLLCYAFDKENYQESKLTFEDIVNNSVADKKVRAVLRAYYELTSNTNDQAIITELL